MVSRLSLLGLLLPLPSASVFFSFSQTQEESRLHHDKDHVPFSSSSLFPPCDFSPFTSPSIPLIDNKFPPLVPKTDEEIQIATWANEKEKKSNLRNGETQYYQLFSIKLKRFLAASRSSFPSEVDVTDWGRGGSKRER